MAGVRQRAQLLRKGLDHLAMGRHNLFQVRGNGFLLGLVFAEHVKAGDVVAMLRRHHVLSVPASENTVRLLPPLTISEDEINQLLATVSTCLDTLEKAST